MSIIVSIIKFITNLPSAAFDYLKKVIGELQQVEWLNAKEVAQSTFAVVFVTMLIALFILASDAIFVTIREALINFSL